MAATNDAWKRSARSKLDRLWVESVRDFGNKDTNRIVVSADSPRLVTDHIDSRQKKVVSDLMPSNLSSMLDIGCGIGRWTGFLSERTDMLTSIDSSDELLRIARKTHPTAKFLNASATRLPFKNSLFDASFVCCVFQHLLDEKSLLQAVREAIRVTKPGGKIVFLEMVSRKTSFRSYAVYRTREEYIGAFAKCGAALLSSNGVHFTYPERIWTFFCKKLLSPFWHSKEHSNRYFWDWLDTRGAVLNFAVKFPLKLLLLASSVIDSLFAERRLKRFSVDQIFVFQKT